MARQTGPVTYSGKVGGAVYKVGKHGKTVGKVPKLTQAQKDAKANLPQNRRTAMLNALASSLKHGVHYYAGGLKHGTFYSNLLSDFREVKRDHRLLFLDRINNNEVHYKYLFKNISPLPVVEFQFTKSAFIADIEINAPATESGNANCFYLQFILFVWNSENDNCLHADLSTPWFSMGDKMGKATTAKFERHKNDSEYLLACRCVLGVNNNEIAWTSTGMRFLLSGSVAADAKKIRQEYEEERAAEREAKLLKPLVVEKPRLVMKEKK